MGLKVLNILAKNTGMTQRITRNAVHTPICLRLVTQVVCLNYF